MQHTLHSLNGRRKRQEFRADHLTPAWEFTPDFGARNIVSTIASVIEEKTDFSFQVIKEKNIKNILDSKRTKSIVNVILIILTGLHENYVLPALQFSWQNLQMD